jgi:hypothetical protein
MASQLLAIKRNQLIKRIKMRKLMLAILAVYVFCSTGCAAGSAYAVKAGTADKAGMADDVSNTCRQSIIDAAVEKCKHYK